MALAARCTEAGMSASQPVLASPCLPGISSVHSAHGIGARLTDLSRSPPPSAQQGPPQSPVPGRILCHQHSLGPRGHPQEKEPAGARAAVTPEEPQAPGQGLWAVQVLRSRVQCKPGVYHPARTVLSQENVEPP